MSKTPLVERPWLAAGGYEFRYDDDRLEIRAPGATRQMLRAVQEEDPERFRSDDAMHEAFEALLANSDLEWVQPVETGDLTSAPILGILGDPQLRAVGPFGYRWVGRWPAFDREHPVSHYEPILQRWGYAPYQLRSPLEDLVEKGVVTFVSSF